MDSLYKTKEKNVRFDNTVIEKNVTYQDVLLNGKIIGCVVQIDKNIFKTITFFQKLIPENIHSELIERCYESEDMGFKFAIFNNLDNLISFHKKNDIEED